MRTVMRKTARKAKEREQDRKRERGRDVDTERKEKGGRKRRKNMQDTRTLNNFVVGLKNSSWFMRIAWKTSHTT